MPCSRRPVDAYVRVMEAAGLPARLVGGDFTPSSGWAGGQAVMARWPDTDAIFAICDRTALGVLAALRHRSADVPGTVAVAGFDDSPLAELSTPPLATATHPVEEIGRSAALAVVGGHRDDVRFPSVLVRRASA